LKKLLIILISGILPVAVFAQLSPGELSEAHKQLEGLSNCTQCHEIGKKVTNEKCLDCHKEIKNLTSKKEGYHASIKVQGKDCFTCHSEHHGRKFQLTKFDHENFDHGLTGYKLQGKHAQLKCGECHKAKYIQPNVSQKKEAGTFLGLDTKCLSCHVDYHQKTLSSDCASCHGFDSFKPAVKFDHHKTDFQLRGKHADVDCVKCHQIEQRAGKKFQQFANVAFANCTACHEDVHKNKFGQDCAKCHNEQSFHQVAQLITFNHDKTGFPLKGKHEKLDCKKCHQQSYTKPIAHQRCADCHKDYHHGQFTQANSATDCGDCHSVNGFTPTSFTIEKHNQGKFKLAGAHLATPCFACHKQDDRWEFQNIGEQCVDCHENIHKGFISEKFIPNQDCSSCHKVDQWADIKFDHHKTNFELAGKHAQISCRTCHFKENEDKKPIQIFANLSTQCETCHTDPHRGQFRENGVTMCERCHGFDGWKAERFNHDQTRFKLEGAHAKVNCAQCHKTKTDPSGTFTQYKLFKEIKCANCHSS